MDPAVKNTVYESIARFGQASNTTVQYVHCRYLLQLGLAVVCGLTSYSHHKSPCPAPSRSIFLPHITPFSTFTSDRVSLQNQTSLPSLAYLKFTCPILSLDHEPLDVSRLFRY